MENIQNLIKTLFCLILNFTMSIILQMQLQQQQTSMLTTSNLNLDKEQVTKNVLIQSLYEANKTLYSLSQLHKGKYVEYTITIIGLQLEYTIRKFFLIDANAYYAINYTKIGSMANSFKLSKANENSNRDKQKPALTITELQIATQFVLYKSVFSTTNSAKQSQTKLCISLLPRCFNCTRHQFVSKTKTSKRFNIHQFVLEFMRLIWRIYSLKLFETKQHFSHNKLKLYPQQIFFWSM